MANKVYRVKAALVQAKTSTALGASLVYIYKGGIVPADQDEAWIKHHLDLDAIEEFNPGDDVAPDLKVSAKS